VDDTTVQEIPEQHRYVIRLGGEQVGLLDYQLDGETMALLHAETDPAHSGQGLAGVLTQAVLDDARERGRSVLPFCPYVSSWIRKHPDYTDLVPPRQREQFGLPAGE
jgi:predicted GNAT family acetyltransferase